MNYQHCRCARLIDSELGQVTVCEDCGKVYLTVQFMTLCFEASAFRALVGMVNRAQSRLDGTGANVVKMPLAAADGLH